MKNLYLELSRLRTSDLLVAKMEAIASAALFTSLRNGAVGVIAICVGHLSTTLFAAKVIVSFAP